MSGFSVLVTDTSWESTEREAAVLAEVGARLILAETGQESELISLVPEADAILTCFAQVTPAVVAAGGRLKVIGRYGIGVDNIAVPDATARGIPVTNVPAYCLDEVAEHVLGLIFCLGRRIHRYDSAVHRGDWSLVVDQPVHRIFGQTLGVVGFGKIGRTVASRAQGLGMHVVAYDPRASDATFVEAGVQRQDLLGLAGASDFVTLHVPSTPETEGMINAGFFAAMRPSAFLLNTARGAVLDQAALVDALARDELAGAGLDVFVPERLAPEHPLITDPRVLATPHVAFYSEESLADLATKAAQNVADVLAGRRPPDTINPEVYGGGERAPE